MTYDIQGQIKKLLKPDKTKQINANMLKAKNKLNSDKSLTCVMDGLIYQNFIKNNVN